MRFRSAVYNYSEINGIQCFRYEKTDWLLNGISNDDFDTNVVGFSQYVQSFISLSNHFCLRNRKHVPCFYRVIQTQVKVWENEKCCGNTSRRRVFRQLFRVLPNFHECLYNSIETRSTCLLFLLENNTTRKRKTTC